MTAPMLTIGFLARERYVLAAESLASLYASTTVPFELVLVDAATPARYLSEMRAVLEHHDNWRFVHADRPLLPAAAKNLILKEAHTEYLCLLENDNLFNRGWLEPLLDACETGGADVAVPLIREGRGTAGHFDHHLGEVVHLDDGRWRVDPVVRPRELSTEREQVTFVEQHCLLFRRSIFDRIGEFDEELNTRDEVDLSLALHHEGATVVLEPGSVVNYVPPTSPPEEDELPYYRIRWDLERAEASRERIRERWSLVDTPGDLGFVRYRNAIPDLPLVRSRLEELCRSGRPVVLLDDGDWFGTEVTDGLPLRPFPEVDGYFGGFPASTSAALTELDRVLEDAPVLVVGWPARWWFDFLPELAHALLEGAETVERGRLLDVYAMGDREVAAR
jgi:GT2 family glycosyltransferase